MSENSDMEIGNHPRSRSKSDDRFNDEYDD